MIINPRRLQKFQKQQKIHTYAITKDAVDEREAAQGKIGNCPMCWKNHHNIEDFPTFLTQTVQDRSKTIFKKKLCYGFLAGISIWSNRQSYKVCNGKHPTTLHGVKLDKNGKANIKNEKSNGEKNEEMKCAPINSGSDVVSMCTVPVRVNKRNPSMKFKHMHFWTVAAKGHLY